MPIFEYLCLECERQFEHFQRTAGAMVTCPHCGRNNLQRLVSLCGVSSDTSRAANLSAAHNRAAAKRYDKQRSEHAQHHEHFGDAARDTKPEE
jgi:putative FmdB family regulatory protein